MAITDPQIATVKKTKKIIILSRSKKSTDKGLV